MIGLHQEFAAWVAAGARDDLPRDVALHAAGCDGCLRLAAAFDALLMVDLGSAQPPPLRAAPLPGASGPMRLARATGAAMAVMLVVGAGVIAGGSLLRPHAPAAEVAVADPTPTPAGRVLSGAGRPSSTPSTTPSPSPTLEPSDSPEATPAVALAATPRPIMGGGPPPVVATPRPAASATPRASSSVSTPPLVTPTASPSPSPTPTPTPTPAATPTASIPPPADTPVPTPTPTPSESPADDPGVTELIDLGQLPLP